MMGIIGSVLAIVIMILPFFLRRVSQNIEREEAIDEMGEALACGDTARIRDLLDKLQNPGG